MAPRTCQLAHRAYRRSYKVSSDKSGTDGNAPKRPHVPEAQTAFRVRPLWSSSNAKDHHLPPVFVVRATHSLSVLSVYDADEIGHGGDDLGISCAAD